MRLLKTRERRTPRVRARTIKIQDPEFLHPDTVSQLRGLTEDEAKRRPIVRERDGVVTQYWRDGIRVRRRAGVTDYRLRRWTRCVRRLKQSSAVRIRGLRRNFAAIGSEPGRPRDFGPRRHAGLRGEGLCRTAGGTLLANAELGIKRGGSIAAQRLKMLTP